MTANSLEELFDRYRHGGDLAALAEVVEVVSPELLRLARGLRPRGQGPEDLVQATFLAALTHAERYDSRRPLRPWLLGILLNKAAGGRRAEAALEGELTEERTAESGAEAEEARRIGANLVNDIAQRNKCSGSLRHHYRSPIAQNFDELRDRRLERRLTIGKRADSRFQAWNIAHMIGT